LVAQKTLFQTSSAKS